MTAEERYNIECQIDALYDEAEYCDDHNNPNGAIAARYEAEQLRKKLDSLDAGTVEECISEDCEDCDPFDVTWDDDKIENRRKAVKTLKEDALITEDACVFIVRFNKNEDEKEFESEDEAIKYAKQKISDEPHVWKLCGTEPVEIANYQSFNLGIKEELAQTLADDKKALDEYWFEDSDPKNTLIGAEDEEEDEDEDPDDIEEDYTGIPEERTDHLEYVDDNPTDDKFKLPKNITKKEDDHCEKVNPVINHDPDDKKVLKEDWRDDVGLAPMWCCKNFKDLYEYMKKHGDADAKDKTFTKLAQEAVKQLKQKYGVSNQEAAEIIARGQALYKLLFENLNEAGLKNGRYVRDGFEMMYDLDNGRKKVNLKTISDKNLLIYKNVCNTCNLNNALQQVEAEIARRDLKEDEHCEKSNIVINHDSDDKDILKDDKNLIEDVEGQKQGYYSSYSDEHKNGKLNRALVNIPDAINLEAIANKISEMAGFRCSPMSLSIKIYPEKYLYVSGIYYDPEKTNVDEIVATIKKMIAEQEEAYKKADVTDFDFELEDTFGDGEDDDSYATIMSITDARDPEKDTYFYVLYHFDEDCFDVEVGYDRWDDPGVYPSNAGGGPLASYDYAVVEGATFGGFYYHTFEDMDGKPMSEAEVLAQYNLSAGQLQKLVTAAEKVAFKAVDDNAYDWCSEHIDLSDYD